MRKNNLGWRIDYIIVNKEFMENVNDSRIEDSYHGSDHIPMELDIEI